MLSILKGIRMCNNHLECIHGYMWGVEGFCVMEDEV